MCLSLPGKNIFLKESFMNTLLHKKSIPKESKMTFFFWILKYQVTRKKGLMYLCIYVCVYLYICLSLCVCVYMSICLCVAVSVFICVFLYVYIYLCLCVYTCVCKGVCIFLKGKNEKREKEPSSPPAQSSAAPDRLFLHPASSLYFCPLTREALWA